MPALSFARDGERLHQHGQKTLSLARTDPATINRKTLDRWPLARLYQLAILGSGTKPPRFPPRETQSY